MYDQNLSVNNQFLQNRERNDSGSLVGGDNKRVMSPSYQGTVEGEGGDQSNNKIQPFPGYRDAATVDREDGDEGWSEHTYDSDEEKHTRNVFFSFLGLILCCGLIIASIVILFMVSTQDMKSTPTSSVHISLLNTDLLASDPAEVTTFPRGLLVEGGYIEIKLKISDVNQNGWYVTLCDSLDKHDIKIDFMKTTGKVKLSN